MTGTVALVAAWLVGCSGGPATGPDPADIDTEPTECDDATCCAEAEPWVLICGHDLPWDAPVRGAFVGVTGDDWTFEATDGAEHTVTVLDVAGLVPDLLSLGEVIVVDGGGCGSDGEGRTGGVFEVRATDGAPLLLVGSGDATVATPPGDLAVTYAWNDATCPTRPDDGCFEEVRSVPVTVAAGDASFVLHQGEQARIAGLEVAVLRAERGIGANDCSDVAGTAASWIARR